MPLETDRRKSDLVIPMDYAIVQWDRTSPVLKPTVALKLSSLVVAMHSLVHAEKCLAVKQVAVQSEMVDCHFLELAMNVPQQLVWALAMNEHYTDELVLHLLPQVVA